MRVLSYNILKGGNGREALLAEVIDVADADVVMLDEADRLASLAAIAKASGYPYYDARRGYSTAFLSRVPVEYHWHKAVWVRSPFLQIIPAGKHLHLWGVHLLSLLSTPTEHIRAREIRMLLQKVDPAVPHMLTGDFNTLAPGDRFDKAAMPRYLQTMLALSGGDIPRHALKQLLDRGYTDALRYLHPAENGWSLPAWEPNTRLDYAFISPQLKDRLVSCQILNEPEAVRQASDHLPLLTEFDL